MIQHMLLFIPSFFLMMMAGRVEKKHRNKGRTLQTNLSFCKLKAELNVYALRQVI